MPQDCRVHGELRFFGATPLPLLCRRERPPKLSAQVVETPLGRLRPDDVLRHDANEIFSRLEAAKWLGQLKASPGNVFEFEDGKLSTGGDCSYATKCVNPYVFQARARPHITATSENECGVLRM